MENNIDIEIIPEYTMMKKVNDSLYLSPEQMEILTNYNIDYKKCHNIKEIINELLLIREECDDDIIENLLDVLSERDYYENFNK